MPLYEYECRACGHQFEQLVRVSTTPACPSCQSKDLERMLSAFAVSSETTRESALRTAKRNVARSPDRKDRLRAETQDTLEHLRDDYGIAPDKPKATP